MTVMMPPLYTPIFSHAGCAMSKWGRGGLHHPPLSLGRA
jgi:hypothetical protein